MGTSMWKLPGLGNHMLDQVRTKGCPRNQHAECSRGGVLVSVRTVIDYSIHSGPGPVCLRVWQRPRPGTASPHQPKLPRVEWYRDSKLFVSSNMHTFVSVPVTEFRILSPGCHLLSSFLFFRSDTTLHSDLSGLQMCGLFSTTPAGCPTT